MKFNSKGPYPSITQSMSNVELFSQIKRLYTSTDIPACCSRSGDVLGGAAREALAYPRRYDFPHPNDAGPL